MFALEAIASIALGILIMDSLDGALKLFTLPDWLDMSSVVVVSLAVAPFVFF